MKVDKNNEYVIGVLGPRYKGNYGLILPAVIKAVDRVKFDADRKASTFVFVHDGVTSGSTGEVIESINKTSGSLRGYGINVTVRKKPLDIEMHGKQSHYRWIDEVIELKPDLLLLFDNDQWHQIQYAKRLAEDAGIPLAVVSINPEKED